MKEYKGIGLFFAICFLGATFVIVGFLIGMKASSLRWERERSMWKENAGQNLAMPENETEMESQKEQLKEVEMEDFSSFLDVSSDSGLLRKNTQYVVMEADLREGTVTEKQEELPDGFVGMDLNSLLDAVEQYNRMPPLSERKKGFLNMEVLGFSRDRVTVQKNYAPNESEEGFYLAVMDYLVVVLLEDKKTIYMTTDISVQMLPEDVQENLTSMIYVENEADLFDFLEAYSS